MKRMISIACLLAMLMSMAPMGAPWAQAAALPLTTEGGYRVGYARVDINPYVVEDDPSSGIMALPLRGYGDVWNRLSVSTLLDDNGDGLVDENDGLKATCIAVSDDDGKTVLLITVDLIGGTMVDDVRPAVIDRVNAAIASGEVTGVQELTIADVYYAGTHTHSGPDTEAYVAKGKTGTNNDGVDLSQVNENLGIWMERTVADICEAAILALKDRAAAELMKDQLSVSDAVSPVLKDRSMVTTRHYNTDVDGDEFVCGDNFNNITKDHYANPSDYRTGKGINPKQVTQADDTVYLLKFRFEDSSKLPIILTSWRGHPSLNTSENYSNSGRYAISSDYVNAYRHALEYGCDVTFDGANGYITGWTLGTAQKCRVAFFSATGGNVNARNFEQITYHGTDGDVIQRGYTWIEKSASTAEIKGRGCSFGVVLAALVQECLDDGLNETSVGYGKIKTTHLNYYAARKTTGITKTSYNAALACNAAVAEGTVTYPFSYTDPETGELFLIGSKFHPGNIIRSWNTTLNAPITTPVKLDMGAILLGQDVAFVSLPVEPFDYYFNDLTLTGEERSAPENNLWNELIDESTYGKPFVLGYCNGAVGYLVNYDGYTYNQGSERWVVGCYESQTSTLEQGTGETMLRIYDQMLTSMAQTGSTSYTASCEHCGEDQLWQPYNAQTELTTGHYYLCADTQTNQIKIAGGQTVCIDLKGHTLTGENRVAYTADTTQDILNIMDSSEGQTGKVQGCGGACGGGSGYGGGTILLSEGDVLNLYSGTLTSYDKTGYSTSNGGVLMVKGTFNMYGGTVTGGTASSFTGSYLSGGAVKTLDRAGSGGCITVSGTINMYGGEITDGTLETITGTVTQNEKGTYVYSETSQLIDGNGPCVYVKDTGIINMYADAAIDQLHCADSDALTIYGNYTGKVELKYDTIPAPEELMDIGNCLADDAGIAADVSHANITFTDAQGKTAAVKGTDLVVSELPYRYGTCQVCGACRWQSVTEADFLAMGKTAMTPGHYILTEDVSVPQRQLNYSGEYSQDVFCLDLAGHTFTGATRAFYLYGGTTLNIFDSVGGGVVDGKSGSAVGGGVIYVENSSFHLYGGTIRHNSEVSDTILAAGAVRVNGGDFYLHGGTVEGSNVSTYGGAIYLTTKNGEIGTFEALGGQVTAGAAAGAGDCVYVSDGCSVTLSGDAEAAEIYFAGSSANALTVENGYTGSVSLKYPDTLELTDLTDIGNCTGKDIFHASITLSNAEEKAVAVKDSDLVVSDTACIYGTCEACGDCQWIPITDAQLDAWGRFDMPGGHYILTEDVDTPQKQINYNADHPGSFCLDLAGHTFTGETRAFLVYANARLNIRDSVGGGVLQGHVKSGSGGVIYINEGEVYLYSGTLRHTNAMTDMILSAGAVRVNGGSFHLNGGTVIGYPVSTYGGAVYVSGTTGCAGSFVVSGGQIISGTAETLGDCVHIAEGGKVVLSGAADIPQISFDSDSAETLIVDGGYTGRVELKYADSVSLADETVLGTILPAGDLSGAVITIADNACKTTAVSGYTLVIKDRHIYQAATTAPGCTQIGYTTYTCSVCGDSYTGDEVAATGHRYETVTVDATCTEDGSVTDTCANCGDIKVQTVPATGHSYEAVITAPTCTEDGYTTYTCSVCGDSYTGDEVAATGHRYETVTVDATCTEDGSVTDTCANCGDIKVQTVPATGHSYEAVITAPTCTENGYTTYTCGCGDSYTTDQVAATGHSYRVDTVAPGCTIPGYSSHSCTNCGYVYYDSILPASGHSYETVTVDASCTENGSITHTCTRCSHVQKEIIPALGHDCDTVYTDAACTTPGYAFHSCRVCGYGFYDTVEPALGHSYSKGICTLCGEKDPNYTVPVSHPAISLKYPTLVFEDVITMNVYFAADGLQDVVEMGLITYTESVDQWSIDNARYVIPGYTWSEADGLYYAATNGIAAKCLGDTIHFAVYYKLSDGTYGYTGLAGYSPRTYAYNQLKTGSAEMKPIVVAMLNYGAAAQNYFSYKPDNPVNAGLTAEQSALVEDYRSDMIAAVTSPNAQKQGVLASNGGFTRRYPTISFEGAFCINYYAAPSATPVDGITMYYWSQEDFDDVEVLTLDNATAAIEMNGAGKEEYHAAVEGIAAKDLDKGVYVCFVYSDGTTTYYSGVLAYSIGKYCSVQAAGSGTFATLAQATAVYGCYAKRLFNKLITP